MPIKPENRGRYPSDWKEIRQRILQRAMQRCEHPGCMAHNGAVGYWNGGIFSRLSASLRDAGYKEGDTVHCSDGTALKIIKIVLTIAHLDHTPENCQDDNLRAWCQRHHLAYDQKHHLTTAYMTRKARANTMELPL